VDLTFEYRTIIFKCEGFGLESFRNDLAKDSTSNISGPIVQLTQYGLSG